MISKEQFLHACQIEIFPSILKKEKDRKKTLFLGMIFFILGVCSLSLLLFFNTSLMNSYIFVFIPIIFFAVAFKYWLNWNTKLQKIFFPYILKKFNLENIKIDLEGKDTFINEDLLDYSCLFPRFFVSKEKMLVEGWGMSGFFDNFNFSIAQIYLAGGDVGFRRRCPSTTFFNGLCIDFPIMKINGYVVLLNTKEKISYAFLKPVPFPNYSLLKNYQVFSDNESDVYKLLNFGFLEALKNIKEIFGNKRVDISFFGNHCLVSVYSCRELFNFFSIFNNPLNLKNYEKAYDKIYSILALMKSVNSKIDKIGNDKIIVNQKIYRTIIAREKSINKHEIFSMYGVAILIWFLIILIMMLVSKYTLI